MGGTPRQRGFTQRPVELRRRWVFMLGVGIGAFAVDAVDALRALRYGQHGETALLAIEVQAHPRPVPLTFIDDLDT